MNNKLQKHVFEGKQIRTILVNNCIWWIAKDICDALGIKNWSAAVERLREDQKGLVRTGTLGGMQEMIRISESGRNKLLFRSRKPAAERIQDWMSDEVLPSIERTGKYSISEEPKELNEFEKMVPTTYAGALQAAAALATQKEQLEVIVCEQDAFICDVMPTVNYAKLIMDSDGLIITSIIAQQEGFASAQALNKWLYEQGVQTYAGGTWRIRTKYANLGLAKIIATQIPQPTGQNKVVYNLKWTEAGHRFIHDLVTTWRYKGAIVPEKLPALPALSAGRSSPKLHWKRIG